MPVVMGILNVTPDSFSDGGDFFSISAAIEQAFSMVEEGAAIIDIGGESSRPGAEPVSLDEELKRVIPLIATLKKEGIQAQLSVDTCKPQVMQAALAEGADIINDITALQSEGALQIAHETGADIVLMHMQGEPRSMQNNPQYSDVVSEVKQYLQQRIDACLALGIPLEKIAIDPGFCFGKTLDHNVELFQRLEDFKSLGCRVLVGVSRKSMIGAILGFRSVEERLAGSLAMALLAAQKGASIIRVHDVKETVDVLKLHQLFSP